MNEFLRKHGKWILAILGVVLMVMWVLPNQGNSGGGVGRDVVVGRIDGVKVRSTELGMASYEVELLHGYAEVVRAELAARGLEYLPRSTQLIFELVGVKNRFKGALSDKRADLNFLLLLREARAMGMPASEADAERIIKDSGVPEEDLLRDLQRYSGRAVTGRDLRRALADFAAIMNARALAQEAVNVSVPEVEHLALNTSSLQTAYIALGTENPPAASEGDVSKQFEAYKDVLPEVAAETPKVVDGHKYPFGYKYPDRVKVEYIRIPWKDVREQAKPKTPAERAEDQEAAWAYYSDPANAGDPMLQAAPATAPATQATRPAKKDFKEVRAALVERQIDLRAMNRMREIGERALAVAAEPFKAAAGGSDHKPELKPEQWVPYANVAAQVKKATGIDLKVYEQSGWLGKQDLGKLPGIGSAGMPTPSGRMEPFVELALAVREITPTQSSLALRLQLQRGADGPLVLDEEGNGYVYRVTEAEKSHAPASVEDVRKQVELDLRRVAYFQARIAEGKLVAADAEKNGIQAAAKHAGQPVLISEAFRRRVQTGGLTADREMKAPPIPGLGNLPAFTDAAFDLAKQVGAVEKASSKPVATSAPASAPATGPGAATASAPAVKGVPTACVPVEEKLTVYVLQVETYRPLPKDQFERMRPMLAEQVLESEQMAFVRDWQSLKQVAARMKWKFEHDESLEQE